MKYTIFGFSQEQVLNLRDDSSISDPSIINQSIKCDRPSQKRETRHKYGEYSNVLLSDSDMEKLQAEFPTDWEERIENLSSYMESHGKSYKNHLATIRIFRKKLPNIHGITLEG